ncbi:MAG: hypothetical protein U0J65_12945 [Christensenellales bacterium]|nr:hypothetical protein [Christensenellales bacterium]
MKLNRADLRKILYDFNSISNRLLQADFQDYNDVLKKFLSFVKSTPIIFDYVIDCGPCKQDMDKEFQEVSESYGRCIFSLGETTEEEICNVFAILSHISDKNIDITFSVADGYTSSRKFQDRVKAFNDRVTMVFIRHIESYLTKIGIDMGIDEKVTYSITVSHGQVNIASDNAMITATNNVGTDLIQLANLINKVKAAATGITGEDAVTLAESLEVIEEETKSDKPKKSLLKMALTGIKTLKGTAEFAAAVAALIQFVQPFLS